MGRDVAEVSPEARAIFDEANEVLGYDLATLCFEGPEAELEATDIQQPAILVTGIAIWRAAQAAGVEHAPDALGGLSLGEYTALHVAGCFSFRDAVKLVQARGRFMQEAANKTPGGMVSLLGADEETADRLCEAASSSGVIQPANFNCPGQIVLSGAGAACQRVLELAEQFDCRATPLRVAGGFHSSLMQPAAEKLRATLDQVEFNPTRVPVVSNVTGDYHGAPDTIRERLVEQICQPVRWQRCVQRLISDGFERFVEIGPGRVLTGLMRKIDRKKEAVNISVAASLTTASVA